MLSGMKAMLGGGRPSGESTGAAPVTVLVIQRDAYDWQAIFKGCTLRDGRAIRVVQTGWDDFVLGPCDNYSRERRKRCIVTVLKNVEDMTAAGPRTRRSETVFPDFVLIRNEVYTPTEDFRNKLYGFMYAGVPSLNSLRSIYLCCERPIMQAELNRLHDEHGDDFPVIEQNYMSGHRGFMYALPFPAVVKVGAAHAGQGKMRIRDHKDMEDFRSMMPVTGGKYCMAEPFEDGEYDLRIQMIGTEIRAFKRQTVSGTWKTNTGTSHSEEIEVTPTYRRWAELAAPLFGGLDILTVDAIHTTGGKEKILEVNGTSSGLFPEREDEDNVTIRNLVLAKLNADPPQEAVDRM